jgi:hypothetical protein
VLAGRKTVGRIRGQILVNGEVIDSNDFQKVTVSSEASLGATYTRSHPNEEG